MIKTKVNIISCCKVDCKWIVLYEKSKVFMGYSLPIKIATAFSYIKDGVYQHEDMTVVDADVQQAIMEMNYEN